MSSIAFFEIQSSNLENAVNFYQNVFNWKFIKDEGLLIEYYRIESNGMHGGLLKRLAQTPPLNCGTNAFTCSILVANFDDVAKLIAENGGQVAMPKFAVPGRCWQGYFIDLDNNVFGVFEMDENAGR